MSQLNLVSVAVLVAVSIFLNQGGMLQQKSS